MDIGFSGTHVGLTGPQYDTVFRLLELCRAEYGPFTLHHGQCIGADYQAHLIALGLGCRIVVHPPTNRSKIARVHSGLFRKRKSYLDRNHDIVEECDAVIIAPREWKERLRNGTWATARYAKKRGRKVIFVFPFGEIRVIEGSNSLTSLCASM